MDRKGLLHIYCGDGKGKTTASVGLAVRAAGYGMKVLFAQFMKNGKSSELKVLAGIGNIELFETPCTEKFIFAMNEEEKNAYRACMNQSWEKLNEKIMSGEYDLVVIDECCSAVSTGMLDIDTVVKTFSARPETVEIVITGRNPHEKLVEIADYVSEMCKVKHPFDCGIPARDGIEQ